MSRLRRLVVDLMRQYAEARRREPVVVPALAALCALLAVVPLVIGVWGGVQLLRGLPDEAAIGRMGEMNQATAVYDAGDQLVFTIFKERRLDVPLARVSPNVQQAILAIEDQRFYQHGGFDLIRIASAAVANLRNRRAAQGGSTITQQLARQSFLTPDKTIRRKLQELLLAARIERRYDKAQILELYLNKVYFGDGLYGIEAASKGFFGKPASDLSVAEAALLAGLVKSPSSYAPTVSVTRAKARRNLVLQVMAQTGAIDDAVYKDARASDVTLVDGLRLDQTAGQYFEEQVRRELVARFGWDQVYQGGLKVYATIDMPMQEAAEAAVAAQLKQLDDRRAQIAARRVKKGTTPPADPEPLQAALVALDPATGAIRAMVGGREFGKSHFNRAVQAKRQPGSAFKPFVYAAALEAGFSPASMITHLSDPIDTVQGAWIPEEEHEVGDAISLRAGLRTSSNRAAVRLLQDVGIPKAVEYAKALGVGDVPEVPSLALGSGEVTLESMTAAYAAFANGGEVPRPFVIRRVEDRSGKVLFEAQPQSTRAVSEQTAFLMTTMLADVIDAGTAARARALGFTLPAAGKTGTTNDYNDAWFVGYTPRLVAGVWVGFDQPRTIMPRGFASDVAVPMWTSFMKVATKGDKPDWYTPPADITTATVCRLSGKLATEGCERAEVIGEDGLPERRSMVYTDYFLEGTEPTHACELHPTRGFFGAVAALFGGDRPEPPPVVAPPPPPPPVRTVAAPPPPPPAAEPEPPKKKRGFWSRVFGRSRDGEDRDREDKDDGDDKDDKKGGDRRGRDRKR
ncbi:MAG: penicillin-binding protein 1A [Vicinamibacterales bacterium]